MRTLNMIQALTQLMKYPGLIVKSENIGTEYYYDGKDFWQRREGNTEWRIVDPSPSLFYPNNEWRINGHVPNGN